MYKKNRITKNLLFLYLNNKKIFEHLVQEEANTDILGFTFQNPFTISNWVLESGIHHISLVQNPPTAFGFPTCWLASGYVNIKCSNFCNYKFCSSRFSYISPIKFPPKIESYISNDLQNFTFQNISFMLHANLFQPIFNICSQPERGVIYM